MTYLSKIHFEWLCVNKKFDITIIINKEGKQHHGQCCF